MRRSLRRLLLPTGIWYLAGALEGVEALRQRRRDEDGSLLGSAADRDPASLRLLTITWWPAGAVALAEAAALARFGAGGRWDRRLAVTGIAVSAGGIALRQWAISSLGRYFVRHVLVRPGQAVVGSGPYRWVRHPSYTGLWLEMTGVGLATGNLASIATCALVPLTGIAARIGGEERELARSLPGYREYLRGRARLVPHVW